MFGLLERMYLQIRGMRFLFFVPLIGYYLFIPIAAWAIGLNPIEHQTILERITQVSYRLVPILSTWWIFLVHKEYVEGEGKDVLILGGGIFSLTGIFFCLNIVCFFSSIIFLCTVEGSVINLIIQMSIISFFTCGLTYFLNFFLQNISVSALIVMIFCTLSVLPSERFYEYQFLILQDNVSWINDGVKFIISGGIFWILGIMFSKKLS